MQDFPSNSREVRKLRPVEPDEKVVVKVIEGKAIRRKPSLGKRIRAMFFAEAEDSKSVAEYIIGDVMVPALKDLIADSVNEGVKRLVFGDSRPHRSSSSRSSNNNTTYTPYNRYSSSNRDRSSQSRRSRSSHVVYDIILPTREDAESVIEDMKAIVERYEFVTCRDLYELVGESFMSTDEKWGWSNLRDATVRRLSNGGYMLELPSPEAIDD